MQEISDVLLDSLLDALKILPFIFLIYIIIEGIEEIKSKEKIEKALSSKFAPLVASFTGVIPECGFSSMCAKLYDNGLIKTGTLIAAFLSASDEGLILMIPSASATDILMLISIKIVYGFIIGFIVNKLFNGIDNKHICTENGECPDCGEQHKKLYDKYLLHPLFHSLKTIVFVLIFNIIFGFLFSDMIIGEARVESFMQNGQGLQPLLTALVGLIPNCASSVFITTAYLNGVIGFAGLLSGLSTNAGLGLLIIFKNKKHLKKNILLTLILLLSGIIIGYLYLTVKILFFC